MNSLFLFAEQPLVRAFGWSLLHFGGRERSSPFCWHWC